jgi:hydrogenase expression/formation protein HypE
VLNEIAEKSCAGILIDESALPVRSEVRGACEILGLDPLYVANEGKLIVFSPGKDAERMLSAMREHESGRESAIIGEVVSDHPGLVVMRTRIGGSRVVDMLSGEQLPRIC